MAEVTLPKTVALAAKKLPADARATLLNEYQAQAKSKGINWLLWLCSLQFFYQRRFGLAIVYLMLMLCGGIGVIWMIVEAFQNNARIDRYNNELAMNLLTTAKLLDS